MQIKREKVWGATVLRLKNMEDQYAKREKVGG